MTLGGLITLVGLVAKTGVLIFEFANHAVIEASPTRLRTILMTTAATVVGHVPIIFATGPGARRAQQPKMRQREYTEAPTRP